MRASIAWPALFDTCDAPHHVASRAACPKNNVTFAVEAVKHGSRRNWDRQPQCGNSSHPLRWALAVSRHRIRMQPLGPTVTRCRGRAKQRLARPWTRGELWPRVDSSRTDPGTGKPLLHCVPDAAKTVFIHTSPHPVLGPVRNRPPATSLQRLAALEKSATNVNFRVERGTCPGARGPEEHPEQAWNKDRRLEPRCGASTHSNFASLEGWRQPLIRQPPPRVTHKPE